jgi:hypothetical protein
MKTSLEYWRRGWWVLVLIKACSVWAAAVTASLGYLLGLNEHHLAVAGLAVWLTVGAAAWGWLFEWFVHTSIGVGADAVDPADAIARLKD